MDSGSVFHFLQHCGIGVLGDLLLFHIQSLPNFYETLWNDWRNKVVDPEHFGRDSVDIRIWINLVSGLEFQLTFGWNFGMIGGGLCCLSEQSCWNVCGLRLLYNRTVSCYWTQCMTLWVVHSLTGRHWTLRTLNLPSLCSTSSPRHCRSLSSFALF